MTTQQRDRPPARMLILAVTIAIAAAGIADAVEGSPSPAEQRSSALASRPASSTDIAGQGERFEGEAAIRNAAAVEADAVPMASGGTFDDIRWGELGTASRGEIRALLEANAACDWWQAAAHDRSPETLQIAREAAQWPALRAGGVSRDARTVVAAIDRGDFEEVRRVAVACHAPPDEPEAPLRHPVCGTPAATASQPCIVKR